MRRGRIFGLETEYAILYQPEVPGSGEAPPFFLVEKLIFESILRGRKSARSSGLKGGYFLENGGLVHMELYLGNQADTPILEVGTPECASPRDLLIYQRAFDRILAVASDQMWAALRQHGYRGRIAFGKNNLDSRGVGYGCHENYLVRFKPGRLDLTLIALALPLLLALASPWLLLVAILVLLTLAVLSVGLFVMLIVHAIPLQSVRRLSERMGERLRALCLRIHGAIPQGVLESFRIGSYYVSNLLLLPLVFGYTVLLKKIAYRPFFRNLTPFLVTRTILTGAGRLNLRTGRFELSQRAGLTTSVSRIILFGRKKTMFDLKGFLYRPLSLLRTTRRLSLALGDSNLSDVSNLLKVGTTALVLEMIEQGEDFSELHLGAPVSALRQVSAAGPWKTLRPLRRGARARTAIEIQREYLRRATEFFASRDCPGVDNAGEILRLWEGALSDLEDNPAALSGRLDWAAKKTLLDQAILGRCNWKVFSAWAHVLRIVPRSLLSRAELGLDDIFARSAFPKRVAMRRRLRRLGLDPTDFPDMRDLFLQCAKIDLRFHEIGCEPGYQRQLEAEDLVDRWTRDEDVQRATREPPAGTRARVRGYYIKLSPSPKFIKANWGEVHLPGTNQVISLADPFQSRLPSD